jgi:hypothetical protein
VPATSGFLRRADPLSVEAPTTPTEAPEPPPAEAPLAPKNTATEPPAGEAEPPARKGARKGRPAAPEVEAIRRPSRAAKADDDAPKPPRKPPTKAPRSRGGATRSVALWADPDGPEAEGPDADLFGADEPPAPARRARAAAPRKNRAAAEADALRDPDDDLPEEA